MAEKLTDDDLKLIVKTINELEEELKTELYEGLSVEQKAIRTKVIRLITRQPDPIPYCNCGTPNWSHDFPTPYCKTCYGVPHSYGK